jgi:hypothetical protein
MLIHRRTPPLILPHDPSPEELLQCWTLSTRDRVEVLGVSVQFVLKPTIS